MGQTKSVPSLGAEFSSASFSQENVNIECSQFPKLRAASSFSLLLSPEFPGVLFIRPLQFFNYT